MKLLIYTVALDSGKAPHYFMMAKLAVTSLLRAGYEGDVAVIHNAPFRMFAAERRQVSEITVHVDQDANGFSFEEQAWLLKFSAHEYLSFDPYDRIIFLDCDTLVLRRLESALRSDFDVCYSTEGTSKMDEGQFSAMLNAEENRLASTLLGANTGFFSLAGAVAKQILVEWEETYLKSAGWPCACRDQAVVNKWILNHSTKAAPLDRGIIAMPFLSDPICDDFLGAEILHLVGVGKDASLRFAYGMWMMHHAFDPACTVFNLMEP